VGFGDIPRLYLTSPPVSPFARRLVMPSRGQRCRARGLRPQHPKDLPEGHDTWTEGVTIVLDDVHQLSLKSGGLIIIEFKVHTSQIVPLTNRR
jgi:hypothetical protein